MGVGKEIQRELGLRADRVQSGRIEDDEPLLQQRMREVDYRVSPARNVNRALALGLERREEVLVLVEAVPARERHRHALHLRDPRQRFAHAVGRRKVERNRHPFVGVVLVLGDRGVLAARLDREQADRWGTRRVVEELRRAHRRAAGGRRQQALPEIGKEDRIDELGLPARELGDEGDDELVLVQPLEQVLDFQVDLGVGELLVGEPFMQAGNARREATTPIAVCLEPCSELAGLGDAVVAGHCLPRGSRLVAVMRHSVERQKHFLCRAVGRQWREPWGSGSMLAPGTIVGRPPPEADQLYCGAANAARESVAPVDKIAELKITRLPAGIDVITKRRPALGDGLGQRRPDRIDKTFVPASRDAAGGEGGPDRRAKQRLVRVDIPDTDDEPAVHQRELDGGVASPRRTPQIAGVACGVERLGPQRGEQRMGVGGRRKPEDCAEAPRDRGSAASSRTSNTMSAWSWAARGGACVYARRLPVMPKCTSSVPSPNRNSRYLLRRSSASTTRPTSLFCSDRGTGQRKRRSYTCTAATRCPTTCGATPRRVVSTSGSSGIVY